MLDPEQNNNQPPHDNRDDFKQIIGLHLHAINYNRSEKNYDAWYWNNMDLFTFTKHLWSEENKNSFLVIEQKIKTISCKYPNVWRGLGRSREATFEIENPLREMDSLVMDSLTKIGFFGNKNKQFEI